MSRFIASGLNLIKNKLKMTSLEQISTKNQKAEELLKSITEQISGIKSVMISRQKKSLSAENAELLKQIETAKQQLIALETRNGKTQISIPGAKTVSVETAAPAQTSQVAKPAATPAGDEKPAPKEKKAKKEKAAAPAKATSAAAAVPEAPIDVGRLDMRVGKIVEVGRHPDADSLYLEKIDCGEANPRTVISGLVKYIPIEEMQNRMCVVLCNLKPAKMRGITSEAMVMCASTPDKVEVLSPPAGAVPGDLVHCEGFERQPDAQLNPKKKIFETCAPDLKTNDDLVACYKGAAFHVPGKGKVVAQSLKNVNVK